ncbi:[NiFe]-hydrogenase assembly chaperone HybE [Denitromonas sp.]|uniref:[NiFe]-hydrogenase assembly chaperone HybE n=1 Tax=Denitromonas sp. TaxID=2734609 RepID=UPI003A8AA052
MSARMRIPAWTPPPPVVAMPWDASPQDAVQAHFDTVWRTAMQGLPFVNDALQVRALRFARIDGDWLGGLVTPWCVQLMLLPGGGRLWADVSAGTRSAVALPVGMLPFIADTSDGMLPAFQYFPLLNSVSGLPAMASAEAVIHDALAAALTPPAPPPEPAAPQIDTGRRRFLRGK